MTAFACVDSVQNANLPTMPRSPKRQRRRVLLDFPDVQKSAPGLAQRSRRVEADKASRPIPAPANANESRWSDPDDRVNTRSPKQIRGFRRGDVVGYMHRRGLDITRDHVEAAHRFRVSWDIAHIGLSNGSAFAEKVGGLVAAPTHGPGALATERLAHQRDVRRALSAISQTGKRLFLAIVVDNLDVTAWCNAEHQRTGWLPDRKKEMGKLTQMLEDLRQHYGIDSRRDMVKQARRELAQR